PLEGGRHIVDQARTGRERRGNGLPGAARGRIFEESIQYHARSAHAAQYSVKHEILRFFSQTRRHDVRTLPARVPDLTLDNQVAAYRDGALIVYGEAGHELFLIVVERADGHGAGSRYRARGHFDA